MLRVNGLDNRSHLDNKDLQALSWLNVPDRVRFFRISHLFRIWHKIAPKYLLPNFKSISNAHTHNTRGSSYNFHLSRELSVSPNGFSFKAIKQWNQLPNSLKSIDNLKTATVFTRSIWVILLCYHLTDSTWYRHFHFTRWFYDCNELYFLKTLFEKVYVDFYRLSFEAALQFCRIVILCVFVNKFIHSFSYQ